MRRDLELSSWKGVECSAISPRNQVSSWALNAELVVTLVVENSPKTLSKTLKEWEIGGTGEAGVDVVGSSLSDTRSSND